MHIPDQCPQCGSDEGIKIINTNGTNAGIDVYCEDCGWPDENRMPERKRCPCITGKRGLTENPDCETEIECSECNGTGWLG